jgi:plasmid rolling circle replication initiator protein Rep
MRVMDDSLKVKEITYFDCQQTLYETFHCCNMETNCRFYLRGANHPAQQDKQLNSSLLMREVSKLIIIYKKKRRKNEFLNREVCLCRIISRARECLTLFPAVLFIL